MFLCEIWLQGQYHRLRLRPYAVHTPFQFGGTGGKRHRLREGMFFYDPSEYYDAQGTMDKVEMQFSIIYMADLYVFEMI